MSIQVALHHKTEYHYDRPVALLPQVIRLRPAPHCRTPILSYALKVLPPEQFLNWQQDAYSNYLARLVFLKPTRDFVVEVDLIAEMVSINPFDFFVDEYATHYPFQYEESLLVELHPYLAVRESGPLLAALLRESKPAKSPIRTIDYLVELNRRLQIAIRYVIRMEPGVQNCEETLAKRSGSCRDTAWLLVQLLRHLGLAARFVSGYLIQLTADVPALDGPSGPDRDFTDLHAWAEVFLPGAGWIGLDPTSGLLAGEGHIPLACTADPQNAAPISGAFHFDKKDEEDDVTTEFRFTMTVQRVVEAPRVTKPYAVEQWDAIDRLGRIIDADLEAHDVRLTMGGEPTFVSIDDRDAAEWNTTALGEKKRLRADALLRRLRDRFAPGGVLHFGQGKWYPGESLPRWAYGCWWRKDGIPVWTEPHLAAEDGRDYGYTSDDAQAFITHLARRMGVEPGHAIPGYEDAWYYLWKERRLPDNLDPLQSNLDDPEERVRLAKVFEQGLNAVVGYALPLRRWQSDDGPSWQSGSWSLRCEHLFLLPGDSAMGYRLPLDSLPWEEKGERQEMTEIDPWAERGPLPTKADLLRRQVVPKRPISMNGVAALVAAQNVIRTAICVEPRHGRLYVFLPPQRNAQDYIELVAAVEATAKALHMPVMLEGYPPPFDPRLLHFKVTPDPGVIEVNIHPAANWPELVANTTTLYQEAHQSRLGAEKFMLDGRHSGTGGGNHIVLGGPTPADSPVLRRPDLLRSLVAYWHNHPSLSYLFSGLFLGPTSQAPRVDEARNDSLHELEIAFQQIDTSGSPPWLVDRVFRNLLVDVSGNTHRTEWCIDKLYSPDSAGGRLGLVELRSFEMPPHARMSLVQQLLVRGLIARFWKKPYHEKLVRWGTQLHDRWMLPHFIAQDFAEVIEELRRDGHAFRDSWFAPHHEFRFPLLGNISVAGIHVELRQALEPWHVLGEETVQTGTARHVDSSVERLEVKVRGLIHPRHAVTCNGRLVPLHPTGVAGEYVAGVRYRAWQPPSCLHPTIPVHAPLVFDVYDRWMGRSLGGCMYHVAHPGGRAYDTFPVNANEAESRRIARFSALGHTPAAMTPPPEEPLREMLFTLDLRHSPAETKEVAPEEHEPETSRVHKMNGTSHAATAPVAAT
jgi:uncharacterized protein (DUF2126 family)/transglutaminase-like putative cysteine protease